MVAWMDAEAVTRTVETGRATYFSRSRNQYWVKGETSGHTQRVVEVRHDCDGDALLVLVDQTGAACHTGAGRASTTGDPVRTRPDDVASRTTTASSSRCAQVVVPVVFGETGPAVQRDAAVVRPGQIDLQVHPLRRRGSTHPTVPVRPSGGGRSPSPMPVDGHGRDAEPAVGDHAPGDAASSVDSPGMEANTGEIALTRTSIAPGGSGVPR